MNDATNRIDATAASEMTAWKYAVRSQGYEGTFEQWMAMVKQLRAEYEAGAAGEPTSEAK